jgi:elongator complex protein 4
VHIALITVAGVKRRNRHLYHLYNLNLPGCSGLAKEAICHLDSCCFAWPNIRAMSFRKRNAVISNTVSSQSTVASSTAKSENVPIPGVRPSPLDGRPTTSTGTSSLDSLLAGHAGLPLGTSLLIEEDGTTDFAGILLRYYAAEGLVQGHQVHALGLSEGWRADLPGVSNEKKSLGRSEAAAEDKMKIAWRYEALSSVASRGSS